MLVLIAMGLFLGTVGLYLGLCIYTWLRKK